jgi:hypothetical protein
MDPDPDSLVRGTGTDPDPSIIKQNSKKTLISTAFLYGFLTLQNDVNVPSKNNKQKK